MSVSRGTDRKLLVLTLLAASLAAVGAAHIPNDYNVSEVPEYNPPDTIDYELPPPTTPVCNFQGPASWRDAQTVDGVQIQQDTHCLPDSPYVVASVTKGTNNVADDVLKQSGLHPGAVEKCCDRDGDGDPDVITVRLEVAEINGATVAPNQNTPTQNIAPGIDPAFWAFVPKTRGPASLWKVDRLLRHPPPVLRVEKGDTLSVELENTHYFPHTIHLHGTDHEWVRSDGTGNDGLPQTSEIPTEPGTNHTYKLTPRQTGAMQYHCHVQADVHIKMGLNSMIVIEEERDNNNVQTLNIGGGKVRHPSQGITEDYTAEYDMVYSDMDKTLHSVPQQFNDPRTTAMVIHRMVETAQQKKEFYILNGKSFPYTLRESTIFVEPSNKYRIRMINAGESTIDMHSHGHKPKAKFKSGVEVPDKGVKRDVHHIGAAQRLGLVLNTTINGLDSYGTGVWALHDHKESAVTTNSQYPGGHISSIVYRQYLTDFGFPKTQGVNPAQYFTEDFYENQVPVFHTFMPKLDDPVDPEKSIAKYRDDTQAGIDLEDSEEITSLRDRIANLQSRIDTLASQQNQTQADERRDVDREPDRQTKDGAGIVDIGATVIGGIGVIAGIALLILG